LIANKQAVLANASAEDINEWLDPASGLYEHDRRLQLLALLAQYDEFENLRPWTLRSNAKYRQVKEFLFPGSMHREINRRTRDFFESITQEDIVATEKAALPLYQAMREVIPSLGEDALDSDIEVVKRLTRLGLQPDQAPAVLDIGCSHGRLLLQISREFPRSKLTGAELSEWYHEKLVEKGITPIQSHAGNLALESDSQDVVVSTDVIEHLRHPVEMVREIHRVLRPGGIFCVGGPAANASFINRNPFTYLWIAAGGVFEPVLPPFHNLYAPMTPLKIVHYGFKRKQLKQLFQQTFPSVSVEMCRYGPLKKFGLAEVAPHLPILRGMGLYVVAFGRK
jgi:2-polyprenyl-3-methyl-5-hydroxy-6-metoxy-1,4-benzoquinol methylase